jgi:YrbI family 3-deoxy-D-manno-octulosonate 8-phosphate phosphatase
MEKYLRLRHTVAFKMKYNHFVTDVDGVLTDGGFLYNETGKVFKKFGPHDSDGFKIIKSLKLSVCAISADKRGFSITKKRLTDMNIPVYLVSEEERFEWVQSRYKLDKTIFVGDGFHDLKLLSSCGLGFSPKNAPAVVKKEANIVTNTVGGNGVILEIALKLRDL